MKKLYPILIAFVLLVGLMAEQKGFAEDSRGKWGFEVKGFKSNEQQEAGWLVGGRWAQYFGSSQVYLGLGGYFGAPTGQTINKEKMYYGGLMVGTDKKMGKSAVFEASLLLGYGEGVMKDNTLNERSHYVVEPSIGLGIALGGGWRFHFTGSYIHMAYAKDFSGPTVGFRFQFRSSTSNKSVND